MTGQREWLAWELAQDRIPDLTPAINQEALPDINRADDIWTASGQQGSPPPAVAKGSGDKILKAWKRHIESCLREIGTTVSGD